MSGYMDLRRSALSGLLVGEDSMPDGNVIDVKQYPDFDKKIGNVWVRSIGYKSRFFPVCETDEDGDTETIHNDTSIPALILEGDTSVKKNGKGVIALHQHARDYKLGKSEVAGLKKGKSGDMMKYGLELANKGYHVICFDFKPFEDRLVTDEKSDDYNAERILKQETTVDGIEPMGIHVLDTMRAVDVMGDYCGIEDVGVIGHSLGGTVALYSMASDDRIKAGVSNCGVATFDSVRNDYKIHNWAWSVHGIKKDFGEFHKLLELISPRALMIASGKGDNIFPIEGAENVVKWGSKYYTECPENLKFEAFNGGHTFPEDVRNGAYKFFDDML